MNRGIKFFSSVTFCSLLVFGGYCAGNYTARSGITVRVSDSGGYITSDRMSMADPRAESNQDGVNAQEVSGDMDGAQKESFLLSGAERNMASAAGNSKGITDENFLAIIRSNATAAKIAASASEKEDFQKSSQPAGDNSKTNTKPADSAGTKTAPDSAGAKVTADSEPININKANSEELQKLPGIGVKTAEKIIGYRNQNGDFASIEEIMAVNGIGEKTFEKIKDFICI